MGDGDANNANNAHNEVKKVDEELATLRGKQEAEQARVKAIYLHERIAVCLFAATSRSE